MQSQMQIETVLAARAFPVELDHDGCIDGSFQQVRLQFSKLEHQKNVRFLFRMIQRHDRIWFQCKAMLTPTPTSFCYLGFLTKDNKEIVPESSEMLKKHGFYRVFARKCWKSNGLIVFSLENVEKQWFYYVFVQKWWKTILRFILFFRSFLY